MSRAEPTHLGATPDDVDITPAMVGAQMLGLDLFSQGQLVARQLQATKDSGEPLYRVVGVQMPRRSQKTTAIWATVLGRCATTEGYKVVMTAQDGQRARNAWREVARILRARRVDVGIRLSNGDEAFEWANGSRLWVVAPNAGSFRGEAADVLWFDEAGEYDPVKSADLHMGAMPLLDTRPMGQAIVSGTPGKVRAGLLWDTLQDGRAGRAGIVDYSVRDDEALVIYTEDGPVLDEDVLARVHPGIGTLTTMERMRERFATMQAPAFEAEYGCRWPFDASTGAIDLTRWESAAVSPVERPERVGIAFDIPREGTCGSIVYAWRDGDVAYVEVVAHEPGVSWVARKALAAAEKYRRVPIAYDSIGANHDPASAISRMKTSQRLEPCNKVVVMAAAQRFVSDLNEGRLRHFGQADLDAAVANATWRELSGGRAFGRKEYTTAISPLVAASLALWSYDKAKDRQPIQIVA